MLNGVAGCGFSGAVMRSLAACIAASADDVIGMLKFCGKNLTLSLIRSDCVLLTKTQKHQ
jgi:hypothetical protein